MLLQDCSFVRETFTAISDNCRHDDVHRVLDGSYAAALHVQAVVIYGAAADTAIESGMVRLIDKWRATYMKPLCPCERIVLPCVVLTSESKSIHTVALWLIRSANAMTYEGMGGWGKNKICRCS
jgi:hypothetical protein